MRTPDTNKMTDIIYNPSTDMHELYSFGARVRRSPDIEPLDRTAYYIESAYSKGRDDVLQTLNSGEVTLEQLNETSALMRNIIASEDPAFEADALFGHAIEPYTDIRDLIKNDSQDMKEF